VQAAKPRTYGNWTRPRAPGIYGLGTVGTGLVILTPAAMVIGFLISALVGVGLGALGAVALAPLALKYNGRSAGEVAYVHLAFWRAKASREDRYLAGMLAEPYGSHQLPGLLAASELLGTNDGLGMPAGIVVVPHTHHYTAVLRLDPEGASLVDDSQIDEWVSGYGAWLSGLAREPGFTAASVTIETAPDPGTRLATAVASQRSEEAPTLAKDVLETIVAGYPRGSARVTAWATVTYSWTGSSRRKGRQAMVNHIASRLPGLCQGLRGTGAGEVRPMSPGEIAEIVGVAYDPAIGPTVEQQHAEGEPTGITWAEAGPRADVAGWDSYRHDSGVSRVWAMDEAPRGTVRAGVLRDLLTPHEMIPRKRVTLCYRPHTPADAARIVERDVRTAHFTQSSRGLARDRATIRAAEQSATEEAEGAGVTRFSLLVAVTMNSAADLDDADTIIEQLAGAAKVGLRPVYAGQRAAFAVGLPTGVILPEHTVLPSTVRETV
jgi:hypothetical protein